MGAGSEKRYMQMVRRQSEEDERERHLRACLRADRTERQPPQPQPRTASKRQVRRWMDANAEEYDGPTQLAEAAACEYPEAADWLDDETHWIWDLAADQYSDW